jgi:hypothetical protein
MTAGLAATNATGYLPGEMRDNVELSKRLADLDQVVSQRGRSCVMSALPPITDIDRRSIWLSVYEYTP